MSRFDLPLNAKNSCKSSWTVRFLVQFRNPPEVYMSSEAEQYFSIPLNMARRKISSLGGQLASSRWPPAFIAIIERYPDLEISAPATARSDNPECDGCMKTRNAPAACDACRISGRLSCSTGHLGGYPYNRVGFQVITQLKALTDGS
jgi:hypothetical protein